MNVFVQEAAEQDILLQTGWYADQELPLVAVRFSAAAIAAIRSLARRPMAGAPRIVPNEQLAGLRTWPVKGFSALRVYYLVQKETVIVVRLLSSRQDTNSILTTQNVTTNE